MAAPWVHQSGCRSTQLLSMTAPWCSIAHRLYSSARVPALSTFHVLWDAAHVPYRHKEWSQVQAAMQPLVPASLSVFCRAQDALTILKDRSLCPEGAKRQVAALRCLLLSTSKGSLAHKVPGSRTAAGTPVACWWHQHARGSIVP